MKLESLKFFARKPWLIPSKIRHTYYVWTHPGEPWLEVQAIQFLKDHLNPQMTVFEWGSGRSTAWLAQRVKKVISIEYNQGWYEKVKSSLAEKDLHNTDLRYIPVEAYPPNFEKPPFPPYVKAIDEFADLDLVIVDGHYRRTCIRNAVDKVKPGGLLLIDDSHREVSPEAWGIPESWKRVHQSFNGFMQTSLFQRPEAPSRGV